MSQNFKIKEFPDVANKLTAPTKKSLFERQKAEQEAKRQKEELETAAVYEDFVKSFDDEGDDDGPPPSFSHRAPSMHSGPGSLGGGFSKRHFTSSSGPPGRGGRGISGPGSLGPPPPTFSRKRPFDGPQASNRDSKHGMFAYDDAPGSLDAKAAFQTSEDEDDADSKSRAQERAVPKPTLHLSSLPPGISPAAIKAILPETIKVEAVRILPSSNPSTVDRPSSSAIVTLAKDTPAADMDTVVSSLQNKYLGWGFQLSLSRHLSAAVVGSALPTAPGLSSNSHPFGAKPIAQGPRGNLSRAPPPGSLRSNFGPPSSYGPSSFNRGGPPLQVNVTPPADLKQLKLIHKTIEAVLTHGPEFEALLMSRSEVQREEKWSWLWDPSSVGGIWYRWRLWDVLTNASTRIKASHDDSNQHIFSSGAAWAAPERALPFEYTTSLNEFVSDSDYNSSDEDDSGDEGRRRLAQLQGGTAILDNDNDGAAYLNPLQKAKLIHLLTRLPTTTAKLRRGDVARVTYFAIKHAGAGADEVVDIITSNVHSPFSLASFSPSSTGGPSAPEEPPLTATDAPDPSTAKLISLYLISDILSSSSTSGVRHAWRYRQLFEQSLRSRHTFSHLGRLERDLAWGRLRAEKWKRSVTSVLTLWEGWCVFPSEAQEGFVNEFQNPILSQAEQDKLRKLEEEERAKEARREKAGGKWKTVGDDDDGGAVSVAAATDADGEPMADEEDVDGEPMEEDEDVDGVPMVSSDEEMADAPPEADRLAGEKGQVTPPPPPPPEETKVESVTRDPVTGAVVNKRRRPRAEDMFADSDGE